MEIAEKANYHIDEAYTKLISILTSAFSRFT